MSMETVNIACSDELLADAPHLAMCLAEEPDDAATYVHANWRDDHGNRYVAKSFPARVEWLYAAQGTLQRPAWDEREDTPYIVNMAAARRAQAALVFDPVTPQRAAPGKITAVLGDPRAAFAAMGVSEIPTDI